MIFVWAFVALHDALSTVDVATTVAKVSGCGINRNLANVAGSDTTMTPLSPAPSVSKIRRPVCKKASTMLRGDSICKQLQNSSFGMFHAAVYDIKSYLPMVEFKLPTVIVVGGRSAGKSSLLENITKCPVFPRDPALCTKMPVKLQLIQVAKESESSVTIDWRGNTVSLRSKDDILQAVADIMAAVDGIVTDELTVTICQVQPLFQLLDLIRCSYAQSISHTTWQSESRLCILVRLPASVVCSIPATPLTAACRNHTYRASPSVLLAQH